MSDHSLWTKMCVLMVGAVLFSAEKLAYAQDQQFATIAGQPKEVVVVVVGAGGTPTFEADFGNWAAEWKVLAQANHWKFTQIDRNDNSGVSQRNRLEETLRENTKARRLWLVLIGHGTASQGVAKFNLVGPDIDSTELREMLQTVTAPLVFVNCSSASAPFLTELSGPNRIVVSATRSGNEINFSRFGKFLAMSLDDVSADLDHDREISLLEAFLAGAGRTTRFYTDEARLATEHALIDDNGDQTGTSLEFYRGIRPAKQSKSGKQIDGNAAARVILYSSPEAIRLSPEQQQARAKIEQELDLLRGRKERLPTEDYLHQLEHLLLELAKIYDAAEQAGQLHDK